MAIGLNNTSLVYGVLDLIKREIDKNNRQTNGTDGALEVEPLGGTPSAVLERLHPDDEEVLTGAKMYYDSGYVMDIQLGLGMTDEEIEAALNKNKYPSEAIEPEEGEPDVLPAFNALSEEEQAGETDGVTGSGSDFEEDDGETGEPTETLPEGVDEKHPDFEYYTKWRLSNVMVDVFDGGGVLVDNYNIKLVYDYRGLLVASTVLRYGEVTASEEEEVEYAPELEEEEFEEEIEDESEDAVINESDEELEESDEELEEESEEDLEESDEEFEGNVLVEEE